VSEAQTEKTGVIGFSESLATYLSRWPSRALEILRHTVADLDEEINRLEKLKEEDKATLKYFIGKLVRAVSVFADTFDKPVLSRYILKPENLTKVSQAIVEIMRAYHMLVSEDLENARSTIDAIAGVIDNASDLITTAVMSAISELTKKLESSDCPEEILNP